ncbi:hypothetical protein [Parvularcula sp. LCG005]|uniref:hypothetical protein n=1 Tax=Parvularcula sp. LCG005 TaxID=3078805 RepID=UPI0029427D1A|nr:hypothetical protein [Parvularcula sp. LCG005]WOI52679.1 hypothetical protein RUI03_11030 [Parvularcula sp. LCG005]
MIGSDSTVLNIAKAMATHAAERQAVVAENIAQADTPGYRARDIEDFATMVRNGGYARVQEDRTAATKINGNSVSLEDQVINLAEAKGEHDMALGLWRQTLSMYQIALGRGR